MMKCHVCGSEEFRDELVVEVFHINSTPVLVENFPSSVCKRCGEVILSRETTEQIRRMVHGEARPIRTISMEVFTYQV